VRADDEVRVQLRERLWWVGRRRLAHSHWPQVRMLTYAAACSRMLTYAEETAGGYSHWPEVRMLTYADACSRMLTYAEETAGGYSHWPEVRMADGLKGAFQALFSAL
jgi:hypothetical protein